MRSPRRPSAEGLLAITEGIVIATFLSVSLRAKRGNLGGGDNVRFFAEFTLSRGTFFDRLRMSGGKSLMKTAKGSE